MTPEQEAILKYTLSQYVKRRFAELVRKGTDGERAYTIAMGEYVEASVAKAKQEARAKR